MREVTQTILHEEGSTIPGNCLQAAVASLLDLDLDTVPHFVVHDDWLERLVAFGREHGHHVKCAAPDARVSLGIASGPSPRGVQHAVVMASGDVVWDPHPSRAGLLAIGLVFAFTPLADAVTAR
jgi:hypothetical protein